MPKFRNKPVVIEAEYFDGTLLEAGRIAHWCGGATAFVGGSSKSKSRACYTINITTLEGTMRAEPGDWVIRGVQGEFYPCKPDVFDITYDAIDPPQEQP